MNNPFADTDRCVNRLLGVYAKHGSILVAADYDDTLAPFRDQTDIYPRTHALMRRCKALGFKIILFTAGEPARYPTMIRYMTDCGFAPDSVNENPIPLSVGCNGKVYYNILLDDKAGLNQALNILELTLDAVDRQRAEAARVRAAI